MTKSEQREAAAILERLAQVIAEAIDKELADRDTGPRQLTRSWKFGTSTAASA